MSLIPPLCSTLDSHLLDVSLTSLLLTRVKSTLSPLPVLKGWDSEVEAAVKVAVFLASWGRGRETEGMGLAGLKAEYGLKEEGLSVGERIRRRRGRGENGSLGGGGEGRAKDRVLKAKAVLLFLSVLLPYLSRKVKEYGEER